MYVNNNKTTKQQQQPLLHSEGNLKTQINIQDDIKYFTLLTLYTQSATAIACPSVHWNIAKNSENLQIFRNFPLSISFNLFCDLKRCLQRDFDTIFHYRILIIYTFIYRLGQTQSSPPKNSIRLTTTKTTNATAATKKKTRKNNRNKVILITKGQLTILYKILRGINSKILIFLMKITYITGTFEIRRGDTNVGVSYEWSKSVLTLSVCYN